jgi:hypothetical protein
MTFIFTPDPRREQMAEFKAGDKVRYRAMAMPAEVLSGPHKSPRDRYLILKADGNVSLVPVTEIERVVSRLDQVADTMAVALYGRSYVSLGGLAQRQLAAAAIRALDIADKTRGQA